MMARLSQKPDTIRYTIFLNGRFCFFGEMNHDDDPEQADVERYTDGDTQAGGSWGKTMEEVTSGQTISR